MYIIDAHCDSPSQMLRLRDYSIDNDHAQVDFPKMIRGGITGAFFALYIPARLGCGVEATEYAFKLLDECERQVRRSPYASLATTRKDVMSNADSGLISVLLGLENGSAIQEDFSLVNKLYDRGVRYITLTHSEDNQIADSCTGKGTWGGLSPFGRNLIPVMNEFGIIIDLAHTSDNTMRDVLDLSEAPVAYTHGCCRALCSHKRNISDELLKRIAQNGGVVGMSVYPFFLDDGFSKIFEDSHLGEKTGIEDAFIADPSDEKKRQAWYDLIDELSELPTPGIEKVVEHIDHAVQIAGVESVAIGTDYDGIEVTAKGLETIAKTASIFKALEARGYSKNDVEKIAGGNWLRLLENVSKLHKIRG